MVEKNSRHHVVNGHRMSNGQAHMTVISSLLELDENHKFMEAVNFGICGKFWHVCCTFASKSINILCKTSLTSHTGPKMTAMIITWICNCGC